MKLEKTFKIIAYVIGILILITGMLSVYFVSYPLFTMQSAPQLILDILLVMNLIIPISGICSMIAFIYLKNKNAR